jgi:DNA-binding SARP family transcriptional activator
MKLKNLNLVLLFLFTSFVYGQIPRSGLHFYSHDHNGDRRTSLILNNGEPYKLERYDNFTLDFDFFLRNDIVKFGYIFRIISNNGENFDFIINNDPNLLFVINKQDLKLQKTPNPDEWNHLTVLFDKKQNNISLRYKDNIIDCPHDMKKLKSLTVCFGLCDLKNFLSNDVPPMILRNVKVSYNGKERHYWELDRHGENVVYDKWRNKPALVYNPYWLINDHVYWKKVTQFDTTIFPQICFDSINNRIYLLKDNELEEYSLLNHSAKVFPSTNTAPLNRFYNCMLFDPLSGRLLYYEFKPGKISSYDFEENVWIRPENEEEADHAHHNRYISAFNSSLYLFGGYGHYRYNSDFFRVNLKTNEWDKFDFSHTITPRYLSAMGGNKTGDKLYILGGRGAEMGRQELSPKNFSDLFEIDLRSNKIKKLFDIEGESEENVYSNSLIMNDDDSCLYVLAYPNNKYSSSIHLKKIDLRTHEATILTDSIDFYFRDATAFCDLYYSPHLSQFITVASYSEDQKNLLTHIYTLNFPPLQLKDVIQQAPSPFNKGIIYLCIGILFLAITGILFIFRKKWFLLYKQIQGDPPATAQKDIALKRSESKNEEGGTKERLFYDFKTKSILFLGGFQVFNKEGKNITGEFTPTLKYILVLVILYTLKNNKGISSSKLQELLWFDKTEEAARNNRSVNMRKLRVLLESLGKGVDITNENSYWTISLPDGIFSDYKESLNIIDRIQKQETIVEEDLFRLLELLSAGNLLPNIQLEWVDSFKTDYSNAIIDVLMHAVNNKKNFCYKNQNIRLKISDCILRIDPINEEALSIKCNALYLMGKKGLAKTAFDNFSKEYNLLLDESYPGTIRNFLGKEGTGGENPEKGF